MVASTTLHQLSKIIKTLEEEERSRNIEIKKCFSFSFPMPCNYGVRSLQDLPKTNRIKHFFKTAKRNRPLKKWPRKFKGLTKKKAAPEFWCKMSPYFVFYQTQLQCKYACRSPVNEINCNKESFLGSQ